MTQTMSLIMGMFRHTWMCFFFFYHVLEGNAFYQWFELLHLSAEALKEIWHDTHQQIKRKLTTRQNTKGTLMFLAGTATTSSRILYCEKLWSRIIQTSLLMEQCHSTITWMSETHLVVYESRHCTLGFTKRPQLALLMNYILMNNFHSHEYCFS